MEIAGQTVTSKRSASPCLHLDRLRDCTVMSRIKPSEITEITASEISQHDQALMESTRDYSLKSDAPLSESLSSSFTSDSATSPSRKWYNVVGHAKIRGYVPRRWRSAATVVSYFEGGAGPGLYTFQLLTCASGQTPFYPTANSSSTSPPKPRFASSSSESPSQVPKYATHDTNTFAHSASSSNTSSSSLPSIAPQDLIIGEFEVVSVRGYFVNPFNVDLVRDGLFPNVTTPTSPTSPTSPPTSPVTPDTVPTTAPAHPTTEPSPSFAFPSPSDSTPSPSTAAPSPSFGSSPYAHPAMFPSEPTFYEVSQTASSRADALYHHGSFTTASTAKHAIVNIIMAGFWLLALVGSWALVHWRLGRKLPFLHPLLALPSLYIYLRLLAFAFFVYNLYEAIIQHELHRIGFVTLGILRRPSCAFTMNSPIPHHLYDNSSWHTTVTSFQTLGPRTTTSHPNIPTASQILRAQLSCSEIYTNGGVLPQGSLQSTVQWPTSQYIVSKIIPALLWSSCMALGTVTAFYVSRGGSLTRPWGLDRKSRWRTAVFASLIFITSFAVTISSSMSINSTRVPPDTPLPTRIGSSWYLRNSDLSNDAKRESINLHFDSTSKSYLASLIPTALSSYLTASVLPNTLESPRLSILLVAVLQNSFFWRICCYTVAVLATKSCLASCGIIDDALQKQMTVLERELHATHSNARDLWNLSRTRPVPVISVTPTRPTEREAAPLVERTSALSQILDPNTSSLAAETPVTPRVGSNEEPEDDEAAARRRRRQEREERKRSPIVLLSKLVRSVRRKQSTFKVVHMAIAITFALGALLALISPAWALQKSKVLNAILFNLLHLFFFSLIFYLFVPNKSSYKSLFQLNKYLRRQNRREERKKKAKEKSLAQRSALGIHASNNNARSADALGIESDDGSDDLNDDPSATVQPLLPWNKDDDDDEDNDDSDGLIGHRNSLELDRHGKRRSLTKALSSASPSSTKPPHASSMTPASERQFASSLLHKASLLADKDGFLSEEAKSALWGDTIEDDLRSPSFPSKSRRSPPLGPSGAGTTTNTTASSSASSTVLLPPIPSIMLENHDADEIALSKNPFSLVIIYPPSVKVNVPSPKVAADPTSSMVSSSNMTPSSSSLSTTALGGGLDDDNEPFTLPFAPVPLHPRLAARLKRSSPLPPSMMAALASPPPAATPTSTSTQSIAPPTILPPSIALARMAHPVSHSETVIQTPRL